MSFVNRYLNNPLGGGELFAPTRPHKWAVTHLNERGQRVTFRTFETKPQAEKVRRLLTGVSSVTGARTLPRVRSWNQPYGVE